MSRHALRRTLALLLFLAVCACERPEMPAAPPATATVRDESWEPPKPPPLAPRKWFAQIGTTGGFSGMGKGSMAVDSDGAPRGKSRCGKQLSLERRIAVETAVAQARPAEWKSSYKLSGASRMTDQFYYFLTLNIEGTAHQAGWQDDSAGLLPPDLLALSKALWAARDEMTNCR